MTLWVVYFRRCVQLGASHFTSGESRCCASFFLALALHFRACHCFRFHLREASRLLISHLSVCVCLFCTKIAAVLVVWAARSSRSFSFHNNGGHRGSQLEPAAPGCPEVHSSQQRVRHIQERNAAYCWSGKKWPDEPGQQIWAPVDRCFTKGAELWVVSGSFGRHCTVLISAHIQK